MAYNKRIKVIWNCKEETQLITVIQISCLPLLIINSIQFKFFIQILCSRLFNILLEDITKSRITGFEK